MTEQDWNFPEGRFLSYVLGPIEQGQAALYIVLNAALQTIEFTFPEAGKHSLWTALLDTGRGGDGDQEFAAGTRLHALPRSTLAFASAS
jgi:glycogen operon protein